MPGPQEETLSLRGVSFEEFHAPFGKVGESSNELDKGLIGATFQWRCGERNSR
jgi:hypothetical protein